LWTAPTFIMPSWWHSPQVNDFGEPKKAKHAAAKNDP
jgi:hypothetical protein